MIKIIKEELNFDIKNELYKLAEGLINFINRDNILNIHGYKKLSRKESTKNINGVDSQFITYNFTLIYEELNDSINTNPEDEDDIFQLMHNRIKDYLEGEGFLLSSHRYYEDNNDNDVFIDKYEKHFKNGQDITVSVRVVNDEWKYDEDVLLYTIKINN